MRAAALGLTMFEDRTQILSKLPALNPAIQEPE